MNAMRNLALSLATAALLAGAPAPAQAQADDLAMMQRFVDLMQGYFGIIEATYDVSSEPEKAAILQMQKIKELLEERGQAASAADVLREVLDESRNPTIRSAAYVLLAETLKETGRSEEATRVLREALKESVAAAQP